VDAAAITAAFTARLCGALAAGAKGQVLWVLRRDDLYAPGLAELGLTPDRLILVRTTSEAETLAAVEDCLGAAGVLAAVGEVEEVDLTAGRRLQLACERRGATGLMVCRRLFGRQSKSRERASPAVAASRWRIGPAPSAIEMDETGAETPGLGAPRWTVRLERARGGRPGAWIMESGDGAVPFRVAGELADHGLAPPQRPDDERGGARGAPIAAAG
jgi:protein ImuA